MQIIGIDLASGPDMTAVTTNFPNCLRIGDKLRIGGQPNSRRTIVARLLNDTSAEIKTFVRSSVAWVCEASPAPKSFEAIGAQDAVQGV